MAKGKRPKPDDKSQSARFVEAAGQVQSDDAQKAFEEAIGKIIKRERVSKINISAKNGEDYIQVPIKSG